MKTYRRFGLVVVFAASVTGAGRAQMIIADAAADYQTGTISSTMTPLPDTKGTGTWSYNLVEVNNDATPTGISGQTPLTYETNIVGGSSPYYGTTPADAYNVIDLPAVSRGVIFPDSPAASPGFVEVHPGGGVFAADLQWTAGAGETGALRLTFDLSRIGVGSGGLTPPAGFDDFSVYENSTLIYSANNLFVGTDTGMQNLLLFNVLAGTKIDFVISASNGVLGYNAAYVSADIKSIPEPSTWALVLMGGAALGVFWKRKRSPLKS